MIRIITNSSFKYRNLLLAVAWFIYATAGLLLYTSWTFTQSGEINTFGIVLKASRYLVYLLCLISFFLFSELNLRSIVFFIISSGIAALTILFNEDRFVLFFFLIIITMFGQDEEDILRISFVANTLVLLVTILFSQLGIIGDYIRTESGRTRHFLGFSWATYASVFFLFFILEFLAVKKGRVCLREYILLIALSVWLFLKTNARYAFVMTLLGLTFFLLFGRRIRGDKEKPWYKVFLATPWAIAIGAILLHWFYNPSNQKWVALNSLLSGRLALGKNALLTYPIKFFGQPIEWIGFNMRETLQGEYNFVDCSYLKILLSDGIALLILLLIILTLCVYFAIINKKYYLVWLLFFMMVFCITEPWLISSIAVNPFILCICAMGIHKQTRKKRAVDLQYSTKKLVL